MRRKRVLAAAAGALIAAAILGGVAYATIPGDGSVFTACMLKNIGTIRLIDPSLPSSNLMSHCTSLEVQVSWNQKGQPGIAGSAGTAGKDGQRGDKGDPCPASDPACVGPKGDKGDPGMRFRGTWNQFVDYASGDIVQHGGSSWTATEYACCGAEPGVSDTWSLLAAAGASGWEIQTQFISVGPLGGKSVSAPCSAGKHVLGGGYNGAGSIEIRESRPDDGGTGWRVTEFNPDRNATITSLVYAICEGG
jgi:hypothetical protein